MEPVTQALLGAATAEWIAGKSLGHGRALDWGASIGMSPDLDVLLGKWRDPDAKTPLGAWIALAIAALVTHPLLDGFTPYGTQLFAPFSRVLFAWNGVAIVDPFYSIMLGFGVFAVLLAHRSGGVHRTASIVLPRRLRMPAES